MEKLKINHQIYYHLLNRHNNIYEYVWDVLFNFSQLYIVYLIRNQNMIIKEFEDITDREYVIGYIPKTDDTLEKGIIVVL